MISGSEVAFFSLSPTDKNYLKSSNFKRHKSIIKLVESPKMLLATILIANNVINISIELSAISIIF